MTESDNIFAQWNARIAPPDAAAAARAKARWDGIAKPLNGLGKLETAIERIAGLTGDARVSIDRRAVAVLCADNGIVAEGVTQTDASVTAVMAERIAQPSHPFVPDFLNVNPDDLRIAPGNIDALDRTIQSLSDGKYRLPVLVRKYFSCHARLVCFNVDPLFSDSLDGLIFLRYSDFPKNTTRAVLRGLPDEVQDAVWTRFYGEPRP